MRRYEELTPDEVVALPPDELAMRILIGTDGAQDRVGAQASLERELGESLRMDAQDAFAEAWHWLVRKGLLMPHPTQSSRDLHRRTRLGTAVAADEEGLARL